MLLATNLLSALKGLKTSDTGIFMHSYISIQIVHVLLKKEIQPLQEFISKSTSTENLFAHYPDVSYISHYYRSR